MRSATTSRIAGTPPLYATWFARMPAATLKSVHEEWVEDPPGGGELDRARVRLRVGHEVLEPPARQALAGDQDERLLGDQRHRREVGHRVVRRLLEQGLAEGVGRRGPEQQLIAVGAAFATRSAPAVPAPPATFSTVTGCPGSCARRGASMRARMSSSPPAGNGTTSVNSRAGQSCARAGMDADKQRDQEGQQ